MNVVLSIVAIAVLALIIPTIIVGIALLSGWVLSLVLGGVLADALNVIFATERFSSGDIPGIVAVLAMVAGFLAIKVNGRESE